jgi:hypothetical protein
MAILETSGKWLHVMASVRGSRDMNADSAIDEE